MANPNVGVSVTCNSDCTQFCPRKGILHCCCIHGEASEDSEDSEDNIEKRVQSVASEPLKGDRTHKSCCLIL